MAPPAGAAHGGQSWAAGPADLSHVIRIADGSMIQCASYMDAVLDEHLRGIQQTLNPGQDPTGAWRFLRGRHLVVRAGPQAPPTCPT